jgi:LysM repeat protein
MGRRYVVKRGDTLAKIARLLYGDAQWANKLAGYNGVLNPDLILVGQTLEIPSKRELQGTVPEPSMPTKPAPPNGVEEIVATFGNILDFIKEDGNLDSRWETEYLGRAPLPFPISLSWDRSKMVRSLYCHKKMVDIFSGVFAAIESEGLREKIRTYGGCFNFRSKRTGSKLSTHSWGIAIDLNPETNPQGKTGDMDLGVAGVFGRFGFKWGGDWSGMTKDPMHFQFCTGY